MKGQGEQDGERPKERRTPHPAEREVLHVTTFCPGASVGGTERYIEDLVLESRYLGIDAHIAWLKAPGSVERRPIEGLRVTELPGAVMRIDPPPADLRAAWKTLLDGIEQGRPLIVHFHTFGRAEADMANACRATSKPYVFTYHTPALFCRRETLLRWGESVCDGEVRALRCGACKLQERTGASRWVAWAGALVSAAVGWIGPHPLSRPLRRLAFVRDLSAFGRDIRSFLDGAAATVAPPRWGVPVLERNGANPRGIRVCPQGVSRAFTGKGSASAWNRTLAEKLLHVGYVGRIAPEKGVHILVQAFLETKYEGARLTVVGFPEDEPPYVRHVKRMAEADSRIRLMPKLGAAALSDLYRELSLLCIPSVSLETGPLTLFEGLEHGLRVWGTATIGQSDMLRQFGRIVEPNAPDVWKTELDDLFSMHAAGVLEPQIRPGRLRTMSDVASEMSALYGEVLAGKQRPDA